MTTATASDYTLPLIGGRHHFLLRRLHSLTGIIFGGYLVVHLIVNATLIQGFAPNDKYQAHVDKIHGIPFLLVTEWVLIFLPIIYHALYGIWITFTAKWNIENYPYEKNYYYIFQRISALILIGFIFFHVLAMKGLFGHSLAFDPDRATATAVHHVNASWILAFVVYPIGVIASAYHTANGFWTAGITWGLTTSAAGIRRWGRLCAGLGVLMFVCGMLAVIAAVHDSSHLTEMLTPALRR